MLAPRFGRLPARRGHDKNRGADPGDRRPGRGLGDLREEPPASAGGLRYELRVSRLAHGGRVWVAVETTVGYLIDIDIILLLVLPLAVNGRASFRHPRHYGCARSRAPWYLPPQFTGCWRTQNSAGIFSWR